MVYPQVGHTNGGQPWRRIKSQPRSMLPTSRARWRCLPHCGHPHLPVVKCRGTGRSQLLLEPAAVTVKRLPRRVGDSPRRSGVCPTTAWCGVRLTALEHPRCGHPHLPVVKCRGARTGRSLLLEPAAVTVKRLPRRAEAGPAGHRLCGGGPPMCGGHMEMPPALVRSRTAREKKIHYPFNCGGAYSQEWKSAYTQGDACVYAKCCVYTPRAHFVSSAFWPCVYALAIGVSTTSSCPRLAYAFGTQFCVCVYACLPLRVQRGRGCVYTQGDACVYTRCVYTQGDALCIHEALCVYTTGAHICACGGLV
jgi:hypothetical protein